MASTSTIVSIPLVNLPTHAGVSNTTNSAQLRSVQNPPLSGQPQNILQLIGQPITTAPVNTHSSNTNSQPRPQSQTSANQSVVATPRSRLRTALSVAGFFFAVIATNWAVGTGVPLLKLARWTAQNDYLQSCIASLGVTEIQTVGCNRTIESGPKPPPYPKRDVLQDDTLSKSCSIRPLLKIGLQLIVKSFSWFQCSPQSTPHCAICALDRLKLRQICRLEGMDWLVTDICALFYYIFIGLLILPLIPKHIHVLWNLDMMLSTSWLVWHVVSTLKYANTASKSKARMCRLRGRQCQCCPKEKDLEA